MQINLNAMKPGVIHNDDYYNTEFWDYVIWNLAFQAIKN